MPSHERESSGERPDSHLKTAGTDFGNLACIPWAKGRLGLPYLCGGVRKSGTALVPSRDVVPGDTSPTVPYCKLLRNKSISGNLDDELFEVVQVIQRSAV